MPEGLYEIKRLTYVKGLGAIVELMDGRHRGEVSADG